MGATLLDTTVLIDALRGRPAAGRLRTLHHRGEVLLTSPINVEELARGLLPGEEQAVKRLLDGLYIPGIGRPEAELAGGWRRLFARQGVTLSQADCLVAAAAALAGARLITGNAKDFPMCDLDVEAWPVGT